MSSNYYQTRYSFDPGRKMVWKAICGYLAGYIPKESVVVDLGSGYCDFINNVDAEKKYAVDSDKNSGKYCNDDVIFLNINAWDIEFANDTIDVIFASNLFEHLSDDELNKLLKRVFSCLKREGKLILIQPNYRYAYREYWDDFTHVKAFSHISLSDLLIAKGAEIVKMQRRFLPYTFKSVFPKSYLLTKLVTV